MLSIFSYHMIWDLWVNTLKALQFPELLYRLL